ncbi:MAG: Ni/Fe hydrogenase subunit alpha [Candidatus Ranarchaeia archaeon]
MTTTKKISIEPLARVEGHGGITVEIEDNRIQNVKVNILEGPRLFEKLVVGKTPSEVASIAPRICAICNLSHKRASLRGLEKALGISNHETTVLYRDLMHHGEMLESHSLHVFFLALPDYFGYPNAVAMAEKLGDTVVKALQLKKYANKIMRVMGGRMIHGENPVLGGFGKVPTDKVLLEIKKEAEELLPFAVDTIDLLATLEIPDHMERETQFICSNPTHDGYDYYGDSILTSDGKTFPAEDYKEAITERTVAHSFAKRSKYNETSFSVNALARIMLLGDRLEGQARDAYKKLVTPRWKRNPLYNNFAQAIEMVHSLEGTIKTVDQLLGREKPPIAKSTRQSGIGTAIVEAPRGTLIHHYEIENGICVKADYITPTAMFLDDVEAFIRKGGETLLSQNKTENIELQFEMIARSFDPCISCSAHLVRVELR